jgi:hypothetical protein
MKTSRRLLSLFLHAGKVKKEVTRWTRCNLSWKYSLNKDHGINNTLIILTYLSRFQIAIPDVATIDPGTKKIIK